MAPESGPALEALMDAAWPASDRQDCGGWVLRAASGVTQRANSVWPREPGTDEHAQLAALREARLWYRAKRLPLIFQVFEDPRSGPLNAVLDAEGFTRQSETVMLVRDGGGSAPAPAHGVEISTEPSVEWLRLWWSVDGRGGAEALGVARAILTGCPALYALVRDGDGGPAGVGRLAMPDGAAAGAGKSHGGLYCMATRPDARRRGYAGQVLRGLLDEGTRRGLAGYWLLVTTANSGARELYARAGFEEASRYLYRQERPKRHLTGC
ncbi:GNAT family N-acetyltransferase [Arthrobacter sp. B3I4]|uniref:GNAT family N-acetyltransferase n=1 Tax=Arthrobacter sp. B3I4 TaxID=3042267 RepID=UPI00277FAA99|nr:GNAT family N-acetyltransferase [Arthrobacter sp. B3I4]MDQ0756311.1 ribosomal protein S18 acetylase RimI-like enzyme [Arthrobacter sp. B3I4]